MNDVRYPQSAIGIMGRGIELDLRSNTELGIELLDAPDGIRPRRDRGEANAPVPGGIHRVSLTAQKRVGKAELRLKVTRLDTGEAEEVALPVKVWGPRMSFICLCQSSNQHLGWDPRPTAQYYRRHDDELVTYDEDGGGNHAWVHARKLERIFHKHGTPVTWLIDDTLADEQAGQITEWHGTYGDGVAFLPRSYFYGNKRNYNLTSTPEELIEIVTPQIEALYRAFDEVGWRFFLRAMGADQWVGSPGSVFMDAARRLGLQGMWGIGYDHETCDTSMYHMGCPWDVYKPKRDNFRVPAAEGDLWCFQWTTRDIINTSYFRPTVGSTTFSTDADDINYNAIPRFQDDYYARMLAEYRKNTSHHDVNVFLVHQEDHDSHIHGSNRVLEDFVDQVHELETFATMDEITAWLNLRYAPDEHPYQLVELNDPLTCHAEMQNLSRKGDIPKRFSENPEWGVDGKPNPPHVAYYGTDYMFLIKRGDATPKIMYDYTHADGHPFEEDGGYPEVQLPAVDNVKITRKQAGKTVTLEVEFEADGSAAALPVATWSATTGPAREGLFIGTDGEGRECPVWKTKNAIVVLVHDVAPGDMKRTVTVPVRPGR